MLPRELNYLRDMLNAARLAQDFVAGIDWATFEVDLMRQAAVTRQFEIIGEAARRISTGTQAKISDIPWSKIIGMRNRLIYEYDDLDPEIIWDTVQLALPELIEALEAIVPPEEI
ncbi:DUF86 domain-containing protein [Nodosilinea sp. P-1105]|uniref:HepT-like ribonuclease domain-containing protein n=1 Tax=Nodosilinea sp. P-1105 TaxID=2546229 RepID=UPI00146ECB7B|nr:DUF86 domain-containing protein [Nodosilinea sp. P-1105]NMF85326.1 DUF86 domain-containing protein [Nodosilinea sp. P-1105]